MENFYDGTDEGKLYRFGTTWGWANDDKQDEETHCVCVSRRAALAHIVIVAPRWPRHVISSQSWGTQRQWAKEDAGLWHCINIWYIGDEKHMACMVYSWFGSSRRCRLESGESQQTVVGQEKSHQGQRDTSSLQYGRLARLGGREREREERAHTGTHQSWISLKRRRERMWRAAFNSYLLLRSSMSLSVLIDVFHFWHGGQPITCTRTPTPVLILAVVFGLSADVHRCSGWPALSICSWPSLLFMSLPPCQTKVLLWSKTFTTLYHWLIGGIQRIKGWH